MVSCDLKQGTLETNQVSGIEIDYPFMIYAHICWQIAEYTKQKATENATLESDMAGFPDALQCSTMEAVACLHLFGLWVRLALPLPCSEVFTRAAIP